MYGLACNLDNSSNHPTSQTTENTKGSSRAYIASYTVRKGAVLRDVNAWQREDYHSPLFGADFKNGWSYTFIIAWYLSARTSLRLTFTWRDCSQQSIGRSGHTAEVSTTLWGHVRELRFSCMLLISAWGGSWVVSFASQLLYPTETVAVGLLTE